MLSTLQKPRKERSIADCAIVVQARLGSSRLPAKVLAALEGRPILDHVVERCIASDVGEVLVAHPEQDRSIALRCRQLGVRSIPGPEKDVLGRFVIAAEAAKSSHIIRVTADCPLIDPDIIADVATAPGNVDYRYHRGYPRGVGDADLLSNNALQRAAAEASSEYDREHVVPYIAARPESFDLSFKDAPEVLRRPEYRVCVDEPADLDAVKAIYEVCSARPLRAIDIVMTLDSHPEIVALNAHVRQRS